MFNDLRGWGQLATITIMIAMGKKLPVLRKYGFIVVLLLVFVLPLQAQDSWSAILYDSLSGAIVEVSAAGNILNEFRLPGSGVYPPNVAVSPTADVFAYVQYGEIATLNIYRRSDNVHRVYSLPADMTTDSLGFVASPMLFTPDETLFAFAYGVSNGDWRVQVYDLQTTGDPVAQLDQRANLPDVSGVSIAGRAPIVKDIHPDGNVTMVLAEAFSGYQVNFETTFIWNIYTGAITNTGIPNSVDGDARSGESLTALFDPAYPNIAFSFRYPQANTLYLADTTGRTMLFNTANLSMFWARFIADGQRILVGGYSPDNRATWLLLNREGGVIGDFPPLQMTGVTGTPTGFVYTVDAGPNAGSLLYHVVVDTNGASAPLELWNGAAGTSHHVVWAG